MIQWFKSMFAAGDVTHAQKDTLSSETTVLSRRSEPPRPALPSVPAIEPAAMRRPQFRSVALGVLFDEVADVSHPEHPFLDREYSPGSYMPATDFSPWVALMRSRQDTGSIDELLGYLAYPTHAQAVRKTMAAFDVRRFVRGPDELIHELWAVLFLGYRYIEPGHESNRVSLLRELLSHTLASWRFELVEESVPHLLEGANKFIRKRNREGTGSGESLLDSDYLAQLDVPEVSQVGEALRRFPVTFRACISYSIHRGSPVIGCIRPQLGGHYGLRQFGLSGEFNRRHFAAADFFQPPENLGALGARMKKEELLAVANAAALPAKKTAKKDELIALLLTNENAKGLLAKHGAGELVQVRTDSRAAFDQWQVRVVALQKIALCLACV